jgi:vesicle-associated membrane protein 7
MRKSWFKSCVWITAGRIPFSFLEDIHNRFVKTYARAILSAPAYTMNDEFSRVLSQQMDYYSTDPNADRLNRLKGEMTQVIKFIIICFSLNILHLSVQFVVVY